MKGRTHLKKQILIVDDDDGIQETLQAALEDEGYEAICAEDGVSALEKLETATTALILLDLMMPRMDGYTFAQHLRQRGRLPAIPLLVLTAHGQAAQRARQLGANDYLEKPFEIELLLEKVASLVA